MAERITRNTTEGNGSKSKENLATFTDYKNSTAPLPAADPLQQPEYGLILLKGSFQTF
jgi:hypothetical protein